MNNQSEIKILSQLKSNEIDWQTDIEDQEESCEIDFELIFKDESGITCKVYIEVKEEKDFFTEDFGLGFESHNFKYNVQEVTEVSELKFYDLEGEEIEVSEKTKQRIIKYIKTGK